jgi:hypothetical protein
MRGAKTASTTKKRIMASPMTPIFDLRNSLAFLFAPWAKAPCPPFLRPRRDLSSLALVASHSRVSYPALILGSRKPYATSTTKFAKSTITAIIKNIACSSGKSFVTTAS